MYSLLIKTTRRCEMVDITRKVQDMLTSHSQPVCVCIVYVPHTTAGVTINENADPTVQQDILMGLDRIVPAGQPFRHLEGNSDAHIKASLMGSSQTIIVENNKLVLGTWQGIYLAEFDGPRQRNVLVQFI
ncbi:MAG: secondary thiamine-phosphate synthase enzyme YjbQ [Syntrophomonas sp.]